MTTETTETTAEMTATASDALRNRRFTWILWAIVLGGLILRVVYILTARQNFLDAFPGHDPFKLGDAYLYQRGATLLTEGKGFINPYQLDLFNVTQQDASHPPLFMLWLWLPSVVGLKTATEHALWSAVLGAGSIAMVGYAGREMIGRRVGIIAALLAAIYPNVFSHDGFLQSESMAIFTTTFTVWMAYRYWHRPSGWNAVWVATGCSLAAMSRSELVLLIPLLFLPLVLRTRTVDLRQRMKWIGVGAVAAAIVMGPWIVFNVTRFDKPVLLSDNLGYTMLTASCDNTYYGDSVGYWDYACAAPTYDRIDAPRNDRSLNEIEFRKAAFDYIGEHKGRFAVVTLVRWARYAGIWDLTHSFDQVHKDIAVEGRESWIAWSGAIGFLIMAPLGIYGAIMMWKRKITLIPVVAPFVAIFFAVTMTFYMNRYRASAEAIVCLMAAVGIDAIWLHFRSRRGPTETVDAS